MRAAIRKVINLDFAPDNDDQLLPVNVEAFENPAEERIALLATADKASRQWAPHWLEQAGFEVRLADSAEEALGLAAATRPSAIIVDAAMNGPNGALLVDALRTVHGRKVPIFGLCTDPRDIALVSQTEASALRRPFDWRLITQRCVREVKAHEAITELRAARDRLDELRNEHDIAARQRAKTAGLDSLTGLPNGERFRSLSHKTISARAYCDKQTSIIAIGIDRFRMVNEAIGHDNANRVLQQFAERLKNCISKRQIIGPSNGTVTAIAARLGGARFAVQIANGDDQQIERFRDAMADELAEPFEVNGQSIYLTVSLGAAVYPLHCNNADELLHFAETAMLEASNSESDYCYYDPEKRLSSTDVLRLDSMLRDALGNNELKLHYQPITDTETGKVVAAEALLRWEHPVEGSISPGIFVPVAEKTGLMKEIGDFVIESACGQLRRWLDAGMAPIRIAVNLSLCQLSRGDVVAVTQEALERYDIDPCLLEIELSERGVLNRRPEVVREIRRLKKTGVRISIDDFGTGQAAIAYLKDLPIDVIKIDRSYVSGADNSDRDRAIACGMVALAQHLDATVIAEGVETNEQLDMLRSWGSHECQGFLFSPAVPGHEFCALFGT